MPSESLSNDTILLSSAGKMWRRILRISAGRSLFCVRLSTFGPRALIAILFGCGVVAAEVEIATGLTRARDLGVPFDGTPGEFNTITDVGGVEVGQTTLVEGEGKLAVGKGPVRTGVTAILPLGRDKIGTPVPAAVYSFNGNGELTGGAWVEESGFLEGPVMLTNTHSVGVVRDAVVEWGAMKPTEDFSLPVVGETWDGELNDINGFHVKKEHVFHALDSAKGGAVEEGNTGGGTGLRAFGFKAGIGTASRVLAKDEGGFCVGVLVQANLGRREQLIVSGVPVGREISDLQPVIQREPEKDGSLLAVIATNAPLLPHQLKRVAKRAALGMARAGAISNNSSGDLFIAFSTAIPTFANARQQWSTLENDDIDPLLAATVQATEEALINALVAAKSMRGVDGRTFYALPHERLREVLRKYNRLVDRQR
jgi:D-aminopeptidase